MVLFECGSPFQWRLSYTKFGNHKRVMWGWFAVSTYPGGINELIEDYAWAGAKMYADGDHSILEQTKETACPES